MAYIDFDEGDVHGGKERQSAPDLFAGRKEFENFKIRLHEEILRSQRRKYSFTLMRVAIEAPQEERERRAQAFAHALKTTIREYDVLCALRPDEFVIAFPETEERYAEQIACRIRQTVEQKLWAEAVDEAHAANFGIACFPQDGTNAEDLLSSAEHDLRIARRMKK